MSRDVPGHLLLPLSWDKGTPEEEKFVVPVLSTSAALGLYGVASYYCQLGLHLLTFYLFVEMEKNPLNTWALMIIHSGHQGRMKAIQILI